MKHLDESPTTGNPAEGQELARELGPYLRSIEYFYGRAGERLDMLDQAYSVLTVGSDDERTKMAERILAYRRSLPVEPLPELLPPITALQSPPSHSRDAVLEEEPCPNEAQRLAAVRDDIADRPATDDLVEVVARAVRHDKVFKEARARVINDATQEGISHHLIVVAAEHGARAAITAQSIGPRTLPEDGK